MLAVIVLIAAYGFSQRSAAALPSTSHLPSPQRPLSKPEPSQLLSNRALRLSEAQRTKIVAIDAEWQRSKAGLVTAMSSFQPKQGQVQEISKSLRGYSQLSREYDSTRAHYWSEALTVLTPSQRKEVQQ